MDMTIPDTAIGTGVAFYTTIDLSDGDKNVGLVNGIEATQCGLLTKEFASSLQSAAQLTGSSYNINLVCNSMSEPLHEEEQTCLVTKDTILCSFDL